MPALKTWGFLLAAGCLIGACAAPAPPEPTATSTPGITLTPYQSPAPGASQTPAPARIASPTPLPTPTATPYLYSIVEGDTLIGIAFRFGLTLADLLAANPGIDPQFLTIGDELIIPVLENAAAAAAIPTPVGFVVPVGNVTCHPAGDGSLWCFQLFENTGGEAVEGLSARFTVYDGDGEPVAERTGLPPVNLLQPGQSIPLAAWFPDAGEAYVFAGQTILSAFPVPADDPRYIPVEIDYDVILNGSTAELTGTVSAAGEAAAAAYRVAVIALDAEGQVVGVRVLQLSGPAGQTFETAVYSLAGEVEEVLVAAEGYP